MKIRAPRIVVRLLSVLLLASAGVTACAESAPSLSAFLGRWQIDPARTRMGRNGPDGNNILRSNTFTFRFAQEGPAVEMATFAQFPQDEPTRTQPVIPDGVVRTCQSKNPCLTVGGDQKEQTFAWFQMDEHLLVRLFWWKGAMYDYSTLTVSSDGRTLTLISWGPDTPYWQNIQVFTKQD